jgi:hypothetical protein
MDAQEKQKPVDTLQERIDKFEALPKMTKAMVLGQAEAMRAIYDEHREILNSCYKQGKGLSVETKIGDNIAILKNRDGYYGFCLKEEKGWRQNANIAKNLDAIVLIALGEKYGKGGNSQFAYFATRMLNMSVE